QVIALPTRDAAISPVPAPFVTAMLPSDPSNSSLRDPGLPLNDANAPLSNAGWVRSGTPLTFAMSSHGPTTTVTLPAFGNFFWTCVHAAELLGLHTSFTPL